MIQPLLLQFILEVDNSQKKMKSIVTVKILTNFEIFSYFRQLSIFFEKINIYITKKKLYYLKRNLCKKQPERQTGKSANFGIFKKQIALNVVKKFFVQAFLMKFLDTLLYIFVTYSFFWKKKFYII